MSIPRHLRDHGLDCGRNAPMQQRRVIPQHRHLLGSDLLERLPQPLGVVQPDRGQNGELRRDHVGRIEPAAQPRLDHPVLHAGRGEGDECCRRQQLVLRHRPLVPGRPVGHLGRLLRPLERLDECLLRDRLTADHHPLAPGVDVGREVRAGRHTVRLEQRGGHPRDRRLPVRPDHVDRGEPVLRHPQQRAQPPHPLQPQLPAQDLPAAQDLVGARYPPSSSSSAR